MQGGAKVDGFKASELRIVDNNTAAYMGGYSVETPDGTVQAGPYASKDDAKAAKRALVDGTRVSETH